MISAVFGLPGSGKTLFLSLLGSRAVAGKSINFRVQDFGAFDKKYDKVFTTFPLNGAYQLDFELLGKKKIEKALILCDEIMMFCDSRNFKSFSDELKFFFSQHRKFEIDIIYASQSYDDTDKKIRGLTDKLYYVQRSVFDDWSVVRPIQAFFRIEQGKIMQGYEFVSKLFNFYFKRSSCYALTDTNHTVKYTLSEDYPLNPWQSEQTENPVELLPKSSSKHLLLR